MRIRGMTALVTGATGGLGAAIARGLADQGADLVVSGRRADVLDRIATEVGGRAVVADLAEPEQVDRLADEAADVDVLIANAALPASGELLDYSPEEIDRALAVNLRAPIVLARLLARRMVERGNGQLVFMGSMAGKAATPATSLYNAAKFGLRGFAHALRQDLHGTGVGVSVVQPGFVRDAGMFAESGATLPTGIGTVRPDAVVDGVLRAIRRDLGEVNVAPVALRGLGAVAGQFPALSQRVLRLMPTRESLGQLVEGQRHKR